MSDQYKYKSVPIINSNDWRNRGDQIQRILSQYDSITKDEAIDCLGDQYASVFRERLGKGDINFDEFTQMCNDAISDSPTTANLIRNTIFDKLSRTECFNMFEQDPVQRQAYARVEYFKERIRNDEFDQVDLRELCDDIFGKETQESEQVYSNLMKSGNVRISETTQEQQMQSSYEQSYYDSIPQQNTQENSNEVLVNDGEIDLNELCQDGDSTQIQGESQDQEINIDELCKGDGSHDTSSKSQQNEEIDINELCANDGAELDMQDMNVVSQEMNQAMDMSMCDMGMELSLG